MITPIWTPYEVMQIYQSHDLRLKAQLMNMYIMKCFTKENAETVIKDNCEYWHLNRADYDEYLQLWDNAIVGELRFK